MIFTGVGVGRDNARGGQINALSQLVESLIVELGNVIGYRIIT